MGQKAKTSEQRGDEALKHALNMPPKPHKPPKGDEKTAISKPRRVTKRARES